MYSGSNQDYALISPLVTFFLTIKGVIEDRYSKILEKKEKKDKEKQSKNFTKSKKQVNKREVKITTNN